MSRIMDAVAGLNLEDDEEDGFDDFDFDAKAEARRAERDQKTDGHRSEVVALMRALAGGIEALGQTMTNLQAQQQETTKAVHMLATMIAKQDTGAADLKGLAGAVRDLQSVMKAPRELIRDADGKPVGVKIKHG